jgi:hypothetical protein
MSEKRVLRKTSEPMSDEVIEGYNIRLHSEELHNLAVLTFIIRETTSKEISISHGGEYDVQSCRMGVNARLKYFGQKILNGGLNTNQNGG